MGQIFRICFQVVEKERSQSNLDSLLDMLQCLIETPPAEDNNQAELRSRLKHFFQTNQFFHFLNGGGFGLCCLPFLNAVLVTGIQRELEGMAEGITIEGVLGNTNTHCPFAEKGEIVLRWDGEICPCLPLLYDHASFVGSWEHKIASHSQGHIQRSSIRQAWSDAENMLLRERLLGKEFSPCLSCRDCWLSDDNQLDCMGYEHPTCGGCLWAEGFIACP